MTKKENKKANRIVRDMKECFRSFHLPIMEAKPEVDYAFSCDFLSQIENEKVLASVVVKYERDSGIININISAGSAIPPGRVTEVLKLFNLLNGMVPIYQYSICPCCNETSVHVGLQVPGSRLSKDRFRRLIGYLLEDTYLYFSLIEEVVAGASTEDIFDKLVNDYKHLIGMESKVTAEMERKIFDDVKLMFSDFDISINDDDRVDDGFIIQLVHPEDLGLFLRVGIKLDREHEIVAVSMAPSFSVPDDKADVMAELVNRINRVCSIDHMFISGERKSVVLLKGVMLDNGAIDKEELKNAFGTLLSNGFKLFPIIKEQLTSDANPETLMRKLIPCYSDKTTIH